MQTIHIDVAENKVDILLNIIRNLKEDIVEGYTVSSSAEQDVFYDERKKRLQLLRKDIKSGKEPTYDFDTATDSLLEDLQA